MRPQREEGLRPEKAAMRWLLLGGTADARRVAEALHQRGVTVIYSVAGLVRTPKIPCRVVCGGFTQFGGLQRYIKQQAIDAILDITHPFAQKMSSTAVAAARACSIPCWRFHRQAWPQRAGDRWQKFSGWSDLIPALADKRSVFLTAGQLTQERLDTLVQLPVKQSGAAPELEVKPEPALKPELEQGPRRFILRTAVEPTIRLPANMHWIKAIGPFSESDERALMTEYQVDVLVSKNSGGNATVAKLSVARELGIPVLMLQRPVLPEADAEFCDETLCVEAVLRLSREWVQ